MPENVQAPITQGQQLGTIKYYLNGSELETVSLIAENAVTKISLLNMTKSILNNWFTLMRE